MSRESALLKNTFIYAMGNFSSKLLSVILLPFYTYYLSTSDFGYFDLILTASSMLTPIISFQISDGLYRFLLDAKGEDEKQQVISTAFLIAIKNIIFTNIIFIIILNSITELRYGYLIMLQIDFSILSALWAQTSRGIRDNVGYSVSGVLATTVLLFSNISLIMFTNMRVDALVISTILSNVVVLGYLEFRLGLRHYIKFHNLNRSLRTALYKYSLPLVPNLLSWWLMSLSDRFIIVHYLGMEANGIYAVANKFPSMLILIYSIFNLAWQDSAISEYNSKDRNAFYTRLFNKLLVLQFTTVFMLLSFTKPIMNLLISYTFSDAWFYVPFLYIGALFSNFSSFYGTGYVSSKETNGAFYTSIAGATVNIILNFILIEKMGIQAASVSTMLAFFVMWVARVYQTRKYLKITIIPKNIVGYGLLLGVFTYLYYVNTFYVQISMGALALIIFLLSNRELVFGVIKLLRQRSSGRRKNDD